LKDRWCIIGSIGVVHAEKCSDLIPYEYNPRKLSERPKNRKQKVLKKYNLAGEIPAINTNDVIVRDISDVIGFTDGIRPCEEYIDVRVPNRELTGSNSKGVQYSF
jgi:hypothetical protein